MPSNEKIVWMPLLESDIGEVDTIARQIHPTLPERLEVFAEKLHLFPQGCFKLVFEGSMSGYALAHPWKLYSIPPLNDFLDELPNDPDCIYIHDVAVLPAARGRNAAGAFVEQISMLARSMGIGELACVSVYGTDVLWARFGFRTDSSDKMISKLTSYGESAKYMVADVATEGSLQTGILAEFGSVATRKKPPVKAA